VCPEAGLFQLQGTEKYDNLEQEQHFNKIISRLGILLTCQYNPDFRANLLGKWTVETWTGSGSEWSLLEILLHRHCTAPFSNQDIITSADSHDDDDNDDHGCSRHRWNVGKLPPDYATKTVQKTAIFILANVRTWNVTMQYSSWSSILRCPTAFGHIFFPRATDARPTVTTNMAVADSTVSRALLFHHMLGSSSCSYW
jgi:hypothetical protein